MPGRYKSDLPDENTNVKCCKINSLSGRHRVLKINLAATTGCGVLGALPVDQPTPIVEENSDDQEVFTSKHVLLQSITEDTSPKGTPGLTCNPSRGLCKSVKIAVLVIIWMVSSYALMAKQEHVIIKHQISIPKLATKGYMITEHVKSEKIRITVEGALLPPYYSNLSVHHMEVWVQLMMAHFIPKNLSEMGPNDFFFVKNISEVWKVPIVSGKLIGNVPEVNHEKLYKLRDLNLTPKNSSRYFLKLKLKTNLKTNFPVSMTYNLQPINKDHGIVYAVFILLGLYVLMIFEIVHRTLAAMLASTLSVAILAALDDRPTLSEIISWIDIETIILLFSMMILVAFFTETGIFDYLSVLAYKLTGGRVWPLINTLCIFTVLLSCFLDNVTTALLMTPVTIRLCEVMKLNPVPVLMSMILYSNVGGAITPIGDPPNVIIASNSHVINAGITFSIFTIHMGVGSIVALVVLYFHLRYGTYRDMNQLRSPQPTEVQDLKREIAVWQRAAASMSSYSRDEEAVKESLQKRTTRLLGRLNTHNHCGSARTTLPSVSSPLRENTYSINLKDLQAQYPIKDKVLLVKSTVTLLFVVAVFFLHSLPTFSKLGLGWTALLGALLLLLLSGTDDLEAILARVEWSTLMFFASLFVVMEALSRLGLIEWIGRLTHDVIMSVGQESRLAVAILLIMWVSAFVSAFVDNIPLTTMMIRIATGLAENTELDLPLQPLIWALSFGACLGGNGTLFGSSSNIVCAGVAEQHGYRFSFIQFMKVGFPVMITTLLVVSVYLMICHCVVTWH